jgi:hypothetical protein
MPIAPFPSNPGASGRWCNRGCLLDKSQYIRDKQEFGVGELEEGFGQNFSV